MTSGRHAHPTIITATRAHIDAIDAAGRIDATRLEQFAQRAVDDVLAKAYAAGAQPNPGTLIIDVRVTAFIPPDH